MFNYKVDLMPFTSMDAAVSTETIPNGVNLIGAPKFWDRGLKGEGIVIAVIDTGCDITHPDLKDRIIGVRNFTDDDLSNPNIVTDRVGHGTHVAGIIAASENGLGIVGVAPKAKLLILKALSRNGGKYAWVANAINYAVSQKVNIISMSLGGSAYVQTLYNAVKNAVTNNISVVCAAGNSGDGNGKTIELGYPAGFNESISVGSIGIEKLSSRFSSSNNQVDLVAPGQGINGRGILSCSPGGGYVELQGTSMACPHVSGALALIMNYAKSQFGRVLTEAEIYAQLISLTIPLGYDKATEGNGMLYLLADDILAKVIKDNDLLNSILK